MASWTLSASTTWTSISSSFETCKVLSNTKTTQTDACLDESKNELAKEKLASKDREGTVVKFNTKPHRIYLALNERSLFVFGALADFLASQSPAEVGMEAANALRKELLESGVIEIVLVCLAQYAQQGMRVGSLRPEDGSLAQCPPVCYLVDEL